MNKRLQQVSELIREKGGQAKELATRADIAGFAKALLERAKKASAKTGAKAKAARGGGAAGEGGGSDHDLYYLYRITRDITDGLIVLDTEGTVVYVNPSAKSILKSPGLKTGQKYAAFMAFDDTGENDEFHQYILDSVYDKNREHEGYIHYTRPDKSRRILRVISSYAYNDDMSETLGVILQFSDVTELEVARRKYDDTAKVFVLLLGMLSLWNFAVGVYEMFDRPFPGFVMTIFIEIMGALGAVYMLKHTSITVPELGLSFKGAGKHILVDGFFTALVLIAMIVAKIIIRKTMPQVISPDSPMFYFSAWGVSETMYPLTVVVQEFLTRGAVQGSIQRIMPGKYCVPISIILSSLFFAALHIYLGMAFMVGSFLLLSVFGIIYEKQKTIWGLCIPHYFLGLSLKIIFGVGA